VDPRQDDSQPTESPGPGRPPPRPLKDIRIASSRRRPLATPIGRLGVGSVLGRTFGIFAKNLLPFAAMSLLLHAPLIAYTLWVYGSKPETPREWAALGRREEVWLVLYFFLAVLTAQLLAGPVTYGVVERLRGASPRFVECVRVGFARLPRLVGTLFLLIGYTFLALLVMGFALGIPMRILQESGEVGGMIGSFGALLILMAFWAIYWVALPVAVVEEVGPRGALRRSRDLTKRNVAKIWLVMVLLSAVNIGLHRLLAEVTPSDFEGVRVANLGQVLISALIVGPLGATAAAVGYHDLRVTAEGVDTETLARVFE
jgi:hypothetical protein